MKLCPEVGLAMIEQAGQSERTNKVFVHRCKSEECGSCTYLTGFIAGFFWTCPKKARDFIESRPELKSAQVYYQMSQQGDNE